MTLLWLCIFVCPNSVTVLFEMFVACWVDLEILWKIVRWILLLLHRNQLSTSSLSSYSCQNTTYWNCYGEVKKSVVNRDSLLDPKAAMDCRFKFSYLSILCISCLSYLFRLGKIIETLITFGILIHSLWSAVGRFAKLRIIG